MSARSPRAGALARERFVGEGFSARWSRVKETVMKPTTKIRPSKKTVQMKGDALVSLMELGLRPLEPMPACRFCGEDCGGFH